MSETLVVVSKVKKYLKETCDVSTSANAVEAMSDILKRECMKAAENAKRNGRKTVMDRDFTEEA